MGPAIKITSGFFEAILIHRKTERQKFCQEVFKMKEKLKEKLEVDFCGVRTIVWEYYELDDVVQDLCKPIVWRLAVNPHIQRMAAGILFLSILFSIEPKGLFALISFNVMAIICLQFIIFGWFVIVIQILGSILDLIDSIKNDNVHYNPNSAEGKALERINNPIPEDQWVVVVEEGEEVDVEGALERLRNRKQQQVDIPSDLS